MGNANLQAKARLTRLGQEADTVYTNYLVGEDTIEARALRLVLDKLNTISYVIDGRESLSYGQTRDLIC